MYLIIEEMSKYGYATTSHHVVNDKLRELDVYSLAPPVAMGPNKNPTRVYVVHKPNLLPASQSSNCNNNLPSHQSHPAGPFLLTTQ